MPGKLGSRWGNKTTHQIFKESFVINPENGCWEWFKSFNHKGYGRFKIMGVMVAAHRYSYSYYIGYLEKEKKVLHRCDNPKCCNPFHLFKGTDYDNTMDAINKGRRPKAQHGTVSMYCNNNCRCEPCVKAGYEYFKSIRIKNNPNAGNGRPQPHGSQWADAKYNCRCVLCIEAHENNLAKRKESRKNNS